MTTKQKRDAMQTAQHMPSRYADLNLASLQKPPVPPLTAPISIHALEPHLKRLLEVASATIAKTRLNLAVDFFSIAMAQEEDRAWHVDVQSVCANVRVDAHPVHGPRAAHASHPCL